MVLSHSSLYSRLLSFFRSLNVLQLDVLVAVAARHYYAIMATIGRRYKLHQRSFGAFSNSCDFQGHAIVSYIVLYDRSREREDGIRFDSKPSCNILYCTGRIMVYRLSKDNKNNDRDNDRDNDSDSNNTIHNPVPFPRRIVGSSPSPHQKSLLSSVLSSLF